MTVIAHLTDIHLPNDPALRLGEFSLKRFMGYMNWHRSRKTIHQFAVLGLLLDDLKAQHVDHIFVSGDLVNLGLDAEFVAGAAWLEALGSAADVSFVPGNHDYYGAGRAFMRGTAFTPFMTSDAQGKVLAGDTGPELPFVRLVDDDVAIIGVNSGMPTPLLKAYGEVSPDQMNLLRDILDRCRAAKLFRCVVLHHPPLAGLTRRSRALRNDEEFTALLQEHGAELVIYGHNHRQQHTRLETVDGTCHVVGTPSASVARSGHYDPGRYNLFTISGRPGAWVTDLNGRGISLELDRVSDLGSIRLNSAADFDEKEALVPVLPPVLPPKG